MATDLNAEILDRLFQTIQQRQGADPDSSYTAKLLSGGPERISKKLGEEAVETVIAAVSKDPDAVAGESADLLYHLLVLWSASGVTPEEVWAKLAAREKMSGIDEKAARVQDGKNAAD